jgi:hypothetical protein
MLEEEFRIQKSEAEQGKAKIQQCGGFGLAIDA